MIFSYNNLSLYSENCAFALELFSEEILLRTGKKPAICDTENQADIIFFCDENIENKDEYIIEEKCGKLYFTAKTIRGIIYAYSHFLRKTVYENGTVNLIENICGKYSPEKKIRGHQAGYRTTPNTYDAWDYDQYFRYYLDMMAFGTNCCEHNASKSGDIFRNCLMKYEQEEFLVESSRLADTVDLDISIWHANEDKETEEQALAIRDKLYGMIPRIDYIFPPGGDPGNMKADDFVERCRKISHILKKHHPDAQMHPSAQAPHCYRDWGDIFTEQLKSEPDEIDMVIMGPNHAFPIHELRKKVPSKYPMRFYPDITHNLRCEYPVNFLKDDWHFALANTLSRESVNPRPTELRTLHRIFSQYTVGSVSYSEGVHDDVNKAIWSALEWNSNADLREILLDYARFFMYGADSEKIADAILLLERNWQGDPVENPCIDLSFNIFTELKNDYTFLNENWRFMLLYFRSCCDKLVKMRRSFENKLRKKAMSYIKSYDGEMALNILEAPFSDEYVSLRNELDLLGEKLFNLIGIQLDVEHYHTDNWERGATLDTIDNNVSDRNFLISKLKKALRLSQEEYRNFIDTLINRNKVEDDEIYYSVALHGLDTLGVNQDGEIYMDIQGDRPYTKENPLPMSMTKVYDNFSFKAKFGGFKPDTDYTLTVVYKTDINEDVVNHKISANGNIIYSGEQYGGETDSVFDDVVLAEGFQSASYKIKHYCFVNGTLDLKIDEPIDGIKICELWIKKA